MDIIRHISRNKIRYAIAFALVMLLVPHISRLLVGNTAIGGTSSYHHMRRAQDITLGRDAVYDTMVAIPRPTAPDAYPYILYLMSMFMPLEAGARLLSLLCGIVSIFLFMLILKQIGIALDTRLYAMVMLVISPVFVFIYTIPDPLALSILFCLIGSYFFLRKGRLCCLISAISFMLASLAGSASPAASMLFLLILLSFDWSLVRRYILVFCLTASVSLAFYGPFFLQFGTAVRPDFLVVNILGDMISDLGGVMGFRLFGLVIALIGIMCSWQDKRKYAFFYIGILLFGLFSVRFPLVRGYLVFLLSLMAAIGIQTLFEMKWELKIVRNITIPALVIGLMVSTISFVSALSVQGPTQSTLEGLQWVQQNTAPDSVVLSHPTFGFWIESVADRKVILDDLYDYYPSVDIVHNDTDTMFYSRNLEKTDDLLWQYNVTHIFIHRDMRDGLVWSEDEEGLLFLFRNNETFAKVFNNDEIEVWEHLREVPQDD